MDFSLNEIQTDLVELAGTILADHSSPEHLKGVEEASGFDSKLWSLFAQAGLISVSLPEDSGGGGLDLVDAALVAEKVGENVAAVPYGEVVAVARACVKGDDFSAILLSRVANGELIRAGLAEGPNSLDTATPTTLASALPTGGYVLSGRKVSVGMPADGYVVSASMPDGQIGLFLVGGELANSSGTTSNNSRVGTIVLSDTPGDLIVADNGETLNRLLGELTVLRCSTQAGVARGALGIAARYCSEREQFGSKIGTFQAVAHRLADGWIDATAMENTARSAAWRIDAGMDSVQAVASAAVWATAGAHRVVHAAQHVHGGIGVDTDYSIHRYFRYAKYLEAALGGNSRALRDLGASLADSEVAIG